MVPIYFYLELTSYMVSKALSFCSGPPAWGPPIRGSHYCGAASCTVLRGQCGESAE